MRLLASTHTHNDLQRRDSAQTSSEKAFSASSFCRHLYDFRGVRTGHAVRILVGAELSMGWVDPRVRLGWVGLGRDFYRFGELGWVVGQKNFQKF